MAESAKEIIDYKENYDRYDRCIRVIARDEMIRVFHWLYTGGKDDIGDYFKTFKEGWKWLTSGERKELTTQPVSVNNMDICLLYKIMMYTCGLSDASKSIWNKPVGVAEEKSLEHSLFLLKEKRNELSHKDFKLRDLSDEDMAVKIEDVTELCHIILKEAGDRFSVDLPDIAESINDMEQKFKKNMGFKAEHLMTLGRQEKKISCDISDMKAIYSPPLIYHKDRRVFLQDLLGIKSDSGDPGTVIVVRGDAGMGKTSLCRYIDWLWTEDFKDIQDLQDYELILLIKCREICTHNVVELLRNYLLPRTMSGCDPYKVPQLLKDLKILWIIDGLEEGTSESIDLTSNLMKEGNIKHRFIITSRPEYIQTITERFHQQDFVEVTLKGVDPKHMFKLLKDFQQHTNDPTSELEQFMKYFDTLKPDIKHEFQNPLKFNLALQFWKVSGKNLDMSSGLGRLYESLENAQMQSLSKKLTDRTNMTENDASRKVKVWFSSLCEIAFHMTYSIYELNISEANRKVLECKCDDLQLSASDCLSTFLSSKGSGEYSFFHSTQQHSLSASYVKGIFNSSDNGSEVLKLFGISQINTKEKNLTAFYEVLLHLVSIVSESLPDYKASVLVHLLNCAIDNKNEWASLRWFGVIKNANYENNFIKLISHVIPTTWFISDQNMKAATKLVDFKWPIGVNIQINEDPRDIELESFLIKLSKSTSEINVTLHLLQHLNIISSGDSSNFLQLICQDNCKCCIIAFSGNLESNVYALLGSNNMNKHCKYLQLKITSAKYISFLCSHAQKFENIEHIFLTFAFRKYDARNIKLNGYKFHTCFIDLYLYYMQDKDVIKAVKLIRSISREFNCIIINNSSQIAIQNFVSLLEGKVKAKAFINNIVDKTGTSSFKVMYGPLPLPFPVIQLTNISFKVGKVENNELELHITTTTKPT